MKKQCINHPKYMYSGKESSPLGLGIAAEPLILGTIQEGRDKTNWIVTQKNGVKVWSRITRLSEMTDQNENQNENQNEKPKGQENKDEVPIKKKAPATRKKKTADTTQSIPIQDATKSPDVDNENDTDTGTVLADNTALNKKEQPKTKRAPTGYNFYMKYKMIQLAKENSTIKPKERMAHAVEIWKSMDENARKKIIEEARKALENGEI